MLPIGSNEGDLQRAWVRSHSAVRGALVVDARAQERLYEQPDDEVTHRAKAPRREGFLHVAIGTGECEDVAQRPDERVADAGQQVERAVALVRAERNEQRT